jgi:hypothetical protein
MYTTCAKKAPTLPGTTSALFFAFSVQAVTRLQGTAGTCKHRRNTHETDRGKAANSAGFEPPTQLGTLAGNVGRWRDAHASRGAIELS